MSEVAQATSLSRATARPFLLTLADLGYVRTDGREFSLRPRLLELGYAYLSALSLTEIAQPHVEDLVSRVHESSSISVLDGNEIVYVVRVPTTRIMTVTIAIGTRFPAYCTSMGRVLLAAKSAAELERYLSGVDLVAHTKNTVIDPERLREVLADVRCLGYALVREELELGLASVAFPIHDGSSAVVAAINVAVNTSRVDPVVLARDVLPLLRETAAEIEAGIQAAKPAAQSRPQAEV